MSAPIDQTTFLRDGDPMVLTATLWRGAMIDRFARAEFFVQRCLLALRKGGLSSVASYLSGPSGPRIGFLMDLLERQVPSPQVTAARASLKELSQRWPLRNALAHGIIRPLKAGVKIEWTPSDCALDGSEIQQLMLTEMFESLARIDALQRQLGSQLGQLRNLLPATPSDEG